MDAKYIKDNPLRCPQWRAERAIELVDHSWLPQSYDDCYIRRYRRFLMAYFAAEGDETKLGTAFLEQPYSYLAYQLYYGPYRELGHLLEAWLLTKESFDKIANALKIEQRTIAHYHALFFDARNRLHNAEWIHEVILGPPYCRGAMMNGVMSEGQRGLLYRLFGYYGGPDLLDAVIRSIEPATMPKCREGLAAWLEEAVNQIAQFFATTAARNDALNTADVVHLLKLAMGRQEKSSKVCGKFPQTDFELFVEGLVARLTGRASARSRRGKTKTQRMPLRTSLSRIRRKTSSNSWYDTTISWSLNI